MSDFAPRHGKLITNEAEARALTLAVDQEDNAVAGYISEKGRVIAYRSPSDECVVYESDISVSADMDWKDVGTPRIYRLDTNDEFQVRDDTRRVFLAQTIRLGAARRMTGWRDRIVALIPEEIGLKEAKIFRTLRDGDIEVTHTYSVLDAIATYAQWVNELAKEFGGTDDIIDVAPDTSGAGTMGNSIAQAWLMREAAEVQLEQARGSLKFALAASANDFSIAELARSLHTDRPNLTRAVKSAQADKQITTLLAGIRDRTAL